MVPYSDTVLHIAAPLGDALGSLPRGRGNWSRMAKAVSPCRPSCFPRWPKTVRLRRESIGWRQRFHRPRVLRVRGEFVLQAAATSPPRKAGLRFVDVDDKSVRLNDGDKPVLVYNHGVITGKNVPENNHERYRSCYVHPVWGIDGEVLTDDFPKDHVHHHGLFWAWPHVKIAGHHYDLWTYGDIHDEFVRWICRQSGPVAALLAVENGWFVGAKKVMIERVWLRSYAVSNDARVLDLEFTWIPVDRPITLRSSDNSYGGLAMRFAVKLPESMQTPDERGVGASVEGDSDYYSQRSSQRRPRECAAALGRLFLSVCRRQHSQRRGDLCGSRPPRLSAHVALAALRRDLRRLPGRERKDIPARQADPIELPHLDSQGCCRRRSSPASI